MPLNRIIFILLVLIHVLPIILLPYFITQDGPIHTYNAFLLHEIISGAHNIFTEIHGINPAAEPNLSGHYLMAALMFILNPFWAEKLLICLYIIGFAFSFRYLIRQISPHYKLYSFLCFPFIYSSILYLGFYNFLLGFVLSMLFFALLLKWENDSQWTKWLLMALLLIVIWFSHLVPFAYCGIFATILYLHRLLKHENKTWLSRLIRLGIIFLPGIILSLIYLASQKGATTGYSSYHFLSRAKALFVRMEPLSFMGYSEGSYILILLIILSYFLISGLARKDKGNYLALVSVLTIIGLFIYFLIPDAMAGGSYIVPRMALYAFIFILLLLSQFKLPPFPVTITAMYSIVSILILGLRYQCSFHFSHAAKDFMNSGEYIHEGSLLFTLRADPVLKQPDGYKSHSQVWVSYHVDSYLALKRSCVNMRNYEIHLDSGRSYFATKWREGYATGELIPVRLGEKSSEKIDFENYNRKAAPNIRYIIAYAEDKQWHDSLRKLIPPSYTLIYTSSNGYTMISEQANTKDLP